MDMTEPTTTVQATDSAPATTTSDDDVLSDDLVEEISIDGMCGVY